MTNSGAASGSGDIFDVKKLRRLVDLMQEHDLSELDLRQGEQRIRIRKGHDPIFTTGAPAMQPAPTTSRAASEAPQATAAAGDSSGTFIKSPMVGTFYSAPNPESPSFVKIGDAVGPDTTVCIIEAMKVFNEIPAECSGKIAAVLVENGQAVEFGQPLFRIDTGR